MEEWVIILQDLRILLLGRDHTMTLRLMKSSIFCYLQLQRREGFQAGPHRVVPGTRKQQAGAVRELTSSKQDGLGSFLRLPVDWLI